MNLFPDAFSCGPVCHLPTSQDGVDRSLNHPKFISIAISGFSPMSDDVVKISTSDPNTQMCHNESQRGVEEEQQGCSVGNNAKKKRKPNGSVTPRKRGSKRTTPKKNNEIKGTASPDSARKIDLLLESKLSAEENSRMFAGRKIHPFFSMWKVGKKSQELANAEPELCKVRRGDGRFTCSPIHVFENCQGDTSSIDWSNWTFLGKTAIAGCIPESLNLPVSEGSVEPLSFNNLLRVPDSSCALISEITLSSSVHQLSVLSDNLQEISLANSTVLANEQTISPPKSDTEPMSRFLQESLKSYYHSCEDKGEGSLWTHKYKPTKVSQVCGNDEYVNFLHGWLHLWRQRRKRLKDSSHMHQSDMQDMDVDYNSYYDMGNINNRKSLQNILLITGPVGSGKSAAVYACAQEQGFNVLELNASDWRNGTAVKRYFGDSLGSHDCKSLLEHSVSSQKKNVKFPSALALPNDKAAEEMDDGVTEVISISDDESHSPDGTYPRLHGKYSLSVCDNSQALVLVEDVDILFPEDRGCIAAIRQISETAKGPIILTSNSNKAGLPDNFDRLNVSFSLPSPHELLCHLYQVCVTEEVNINPFLLERFIQSCNEDTRKTTMQLQFWFQSKKYTKDQKVQAVYGSLPFDLEASHLILPKIIPWSFPSELSKIIEKEVADSLTILEEKSCLPGLVKKELHTNERRNDLDVHYMGTDVEAMKRNMIKMNRSIGNCNELESQYNAIYESSTCSEPPQASSRQNDQRKPVVVSCDSVDECPNGHFRNAHVEAYKGHSHDGNFESPSKFQHNQSYTGMPFCKLVCSDMDLSNEQQSKYLETADDASLNETCKSFDTSCVPELMYTHETATKNEMETMFGAVSSGHLPQPAEVSPNDGFTPFTFNGHQCLAEFPQKIELSVNTRIPESYAKAAVQYFLDENMETITVHNVTNECIHDDFKLNAKLVDSNPSLETDIVQSLWTKLRNCRMDLRQHASSEQLGATRVLKLASGLSNLLSEADLLFRNHQQKNCGMLEHPISLADEATFCWYDEQMMMSTVAEHGFCFYAKHVSEAGSMLGCETNSIDLSAEMLASTTDLMALGKLSRQEQTKSVDISIENQLELSKPRNKRSEKKKSLFNVIRSIVPARLSLVLKGIALGEYLSSLRQISISEYYRITKGIEKKRRGRKRGAVHYLSSGKMTLSPEDISMVCEGDLYRKISSQYADYVEKKTTWIRL